MTLDSPRMRFAQHFTHSINFLSCDQMKRINLLAALSPRFPVTRQPSRSLCDDNEVDSSRSAVSRKISNKPNHSYSMLSLASKLACTMAMILQGYFRILNFFDIAEAIEVDRLRALLGPEAGPLTAAFRHRAPEYSQVQQAPIVESVGSVTLLTNEKLDARIKY
jgi:hypothetical protein